MKAKYRRIKQSKTSPRPKRSRDLPITQRMLFGVRDELNSRVSSVEYQLRSDIKKQGADLRSEMESFGTGLRAEMDLFRGAMRFEMASFKNEMRSEMTSFKDEMRSEMASFKDEMKFEMASFTAGMISFKDEIKSEVNSFRGEIKILREDISRIDHKMDSRFDKVLAEVHRIGVLVEEQNARNKFVLDGYAVLYDRQGKVEQQVHSFEKTLLDLKSK